VIRLATPAISAPAANAAALERELAWLTSLIDTAIRIYLGNECEYAVVRQIPPPEAEEGSSFYERTVRDCDLSFDERAILALAVAPHVRPQIFDPLLMKNPNLDRGFTEFGGVLSGSHSGFLPTVETAAFLLSGGRLERRFEIQALFEAGSPSRLRQLLRHDDAPGASLFSSAINVAKQYLEPFTTGTSFHPAFSNTFPARLLTTAQEWSDLVLTENTLDEVEEIRAWIEHRDALLNEWQLAKKIKPGFRSLFYGPPGTGKTFTVSLLGKTTGLDVYRVDLSLIVSKWIGETEKNLAGVFDQAEDKNWILFFDEADALFGKRTQTSSSNDRYANQEVAYLLQRVEDFPGVVILATNLKSNIDEAFARRFQSMIFFSVPGPAERLRLWRGAFSDLSRLEDSVDLEQLAAEFELSGGAIVNVLRYASLMALRRNAEKVRLQDIRHGIRREFRKSGKAL
jgi:ATPase family associated with various cellular activities (AAA)